MYSLLEVEAKSLEQDWVKALSLLHMALRKTNAYPSVAVFSNVCSMNKGQVLEVPSPPGFICSSQQLNEGILLPF